MPRIYYLIPDINKLEFSLPKLFRAAKQRRLKFYLRKSLFGHRKVNGGTKVMYQHCLILQKLGYQAEPVLMGNYHGNYFGYNLKAKRFKEAQGEISKQDIVVSTEFEPYDALRFPAARKIMFMQNWANVRRRLKPEDQDKSYLDIGYDSIFTCGDYCTQFIKQEMGADAFTVTNFIDHSRFFPAPDKRVSGRVLVLSRKNYNDFLKIRALCGKDVDFHVIDGFFTEDEIIDELQKSDIFLATGYPEGLPLPPLEAMNCGCVVVGFTGRGASEYMIDSETAMVADDGDCKTAAAKLLHVLKNPVLKERLRAQGYQKALSYSEQQTQQLLDEFFRSQVSSKS